MEADPRTLAGAGGRLELGRVLAALRADGLLPADFQPPSQTTAIQHPLGVIAGWALADCRRQGACLDMSALLEWLAARVGLAWRDIHPLDIDVAQVTAAISHAFARHHRILVLDAKPPRLVVAVAEPYDLSWCQGLLDRKVERVLADPAQIDRYTEEFYALARAVHEADSRATGGGSAASGTDPVEGLLHYALARGASDLHFEPRADGCRVRLRIDGLLHPLYRLPRHAATSFLNRVKLLGNMDLAEKRRPQDGRLRIQVPGHAEVELRLSTLPTAHGEKLVIRAFRPELLFQDLPSLGLEGEDHDLWCRLISMADGMVLVTGPTGSGKTTTLYSSLKRLATTEVNVSTIEDPIEIMAAEFNQTQILPAVGLDFAAGIRALLRQDPDILMVGEIRDPETARQACQAALTGHRVLSTLHTRDTLEAVIRLLDLGLPAYLIKSTLHGVMAQRLVRRLCPACRQPIRPPEHKWRALLAAGPAPDWTYHPVGCMDCHGTGYRGRLGIFEILPFGEDLRTLVSPGCDVAALRRQARRLGIRTLRMSGAQRVEQGATSLDEVLRVVGDVIVDDLSSAGDGAVQPH